MLPTVVSDGWAAVILWPSVRIRSMSSPERGEGLSYRCPERTHPTTAIRPEAGSGASNVTQKNKCSNASRKPLAEQLVPPGFLQYGSLGCNADSKLTEDHKWQV